MLTPRTDGFDLSLASGGHPAPLLLRADGTADYQAAGGGPFLGVIDDVVFTRPRSGWAPGDTFLLYTDGLTEARTGEGRERYGDQALRAFAAGIAPATATTAIDAISVLLEGLGDGLDDDIAVLALSVPSPPWGTPAADLARLTASARERSDHIVRRGNAGDVPGDARAS